jgi:hypothetical protein
LNLTPTMDQHHATALLLGRLGEAVSDATHRAKGRSGGDEEAPAGIDELEALGRQLQALGRMCGGRGALAPERIDLGEALAQVRDEWTLALQARGATLEVPERRVDVRVNAGVLKQALDLALGHALALGSQLRAEIGVHGMPPRPTLSLYAAPPARELFSVAPATLEELHWVLLSQLTAATGLPLERRVEARSVVLRLGFDAA